MQDIEIIDPAFSHFVMHNAPLQKLASGFDWVEGPVWFGDADCLLFSDIPNNRIMRWGPTSGLSTYRAPSNYANGHTRDRQGRLVSCEHGTRRVTRTEHDGSITVIADSHDGKRLNSPNDVVVASDGAIWFTDPHYGIMTDYEGYRAEQEQPCHVYRVDPSGTIKAVITDMMCPNGLAFSPDESLFTWPIPDACTRTIRSISGSMMCRRAAPCAGGISIPSTQAAPMASGWTAMATSGPRQATGCIVSRQTGT